MHAAWSKSAELMQVAGVDPSGVWRGLHILATNCSEGELQKLLENARRASDLSTLSGVSPRDDSSVPLGMGAGGMPHVAADTGGGSVSVALSYSSSAMAAPEMATTVRGLMALGAAAGALSHTLSFSGAAKNYTRAKHFLTSAERLFGMPDNAVPGGLLFQVVCNDADQKITISDLPGVPSGSGLKQCFDFAKENRVSLPFVSFDGDMEYGQ